MNRAVRLGVETNYGVAVTPDVYLPLVGDGLKRVDSTQTFRPERRLSKMRQVRNRISVSGPLDVYLDYDRLGLILRWIAAIPTSEALAALGFRHTFIPSSGFVPPSLTVDIARDVELHRYTGVAFQSLRMAMTTQDRHFGLSLACLGKDELSAGAIPNVDEDEFPTAAVITGTDLFPNPSAFKVSISDGVNLWSDVFCESWDMSISWDRVLRTPERRLNPTGIKGGGITGMSIRVGTLYDFDSSFLLDAIRSKTPVSVILTMHGEPMGGPDQETLEITVPNCMVNGDVPTLKDSGFGNIGFVVDNEILHDSDSGWPFKITVDNHVEEYP